MTINPFHHKKKKTEGHLNHERWVISYADLLTLLLATFVVLYASSTRNKLREEEVAKAFIAAFHGNPSTVIIRPPTGSSGELQHNVSPVPRQAVTPGSKLPQTVSKQINAEMQQLEALALKLKTVFQPMLATKQVAINNTPLSLSIQLNDSVLFASGEATLKPAAAVLLNKVALGLMHLPKGFHIIVRGYTDNQPISTSQFSSNWSLSVERAVAVVQLFQKAGVPGEALGAEGFGPYQPLDSNNTASGRAKNRRVEVVVQAPTPGRTASSTPAPSTGFKD